MNRTRRLTDIGQSLWLDNITRTLLDDGTLARYIAEYSITGLTSNPSIFDAAIRSGDAYDADIRVKAAAGLQHEDLFIELALDDLRRAADLFKPAFDATRKVDGWVSMEVSPLLASDTAGSVEAARRIHAAARRENLFVKIPGTPEGVPAIEEAIYLGIPINVTLLFSRDQYVATAEAYMRGIERRVGEGKSPDVASVASLFISRWDVAANEHLPPARHNQLGIAVGQQTYHAYRDLLASSRWKTLAVAGAMPQRLLWASTGTKDPAAPDTLYVSALAASDTIDTLPEKTLRAFADHGEVDSALDDRGQHCREVFAQAHEAGIDVDELATRLQEEGKAAFVKSWNSLLDCVALKAASSAGT